MADIQDYITCIIKNHGTLTTSSPIHININNINNRLVFKTKDGSWITIENMKLVGSRKKLKHNTKNG